MTTSLLRSSILTGGVLALRLVTQAVTLVLLTRLLGPEYFGVFAAVASLAVVMGILPSLGAGFVMMSRAPSGESAIRDVWFYAWPMTLVLGVILVAIYMPLASLVDDTGLLGWGLLLGVAVTELVIMPLAGLLSSALQAHDRVPLSQLVQWIPFGLRTVAVFPCFFLDESSRLTGYVISQLIATLVGVLLVITITGTQVQLGWRARAVRWSEIREGSTFSLMHIVAVNPSELDKIMAAKQVGAHDAGIYVAATRVMGAMVMPVIALLLSLQPQLFRHAGVEKRQLSRLVRMMIIFCVVWGAVCAVLLLSGGPLLARLFGEKYIALEKLSSWIALVTIPLSLRLAAGSLLMAIGKPLARVTFEILGIGVMLLSIAMLAPAYGVRGMVMALMASESSMVILGWWFVWRWWKQRWLVQA